MVVLNGSLPLPKRGHARAANIVQFRTGSYLAGFGKPGIQPGPLPLPIQTSMVFGNWFSGNTGCKFYHHV